MVHTQHKVPPLVRGEFDAASTDVQFPEFNDRGDPMAIRKTAHSAGALACVGQCLEPDLLGSAAEAARHPDTRLRGSSLRLDIGPGSVTAYADLSGQWPLYHASRGGRIHYSSDAEDLAEKVGKQLDPLALAYYIIGGEFLDPSRTVFKGVSRLPAGHALRLSSAGAHIDEYASLVPDSTVKLHDTAEELRHHLREATLLCPGDEAEQFYAFSGGYDSTSLAFLKAALQPNRRRLMAYHTQRIASLSGDTAYAKSFAALDPRIDLTHIIVPDDIVPYDDLWAADANYPFAQVDGVVRKTIDFELQQLKDRGATVRITGEGGDALFTAPPQYLADLMDHPYRNVRRLLREGTLLAHEGEVAFSGLIGAMRRQSGFSTARALDAIASSVEHYADGDDGQLTWHTLTATAVPLLSAGMRRQLAEQIHARSRRVVSDSKLGIADFVDISDLRLSGRFTANLRRHSDAYHIATRSPFLDDPVVAARFKLQTHLLADPMQFKRLLQETLRDYVPPEVFARHSKGSYSKEAYEGIRKNAEMLRSLFGRNSYLVALGVVDPNAMQQLITNAEHGMEIPLDALERATSMELWLRQYFGENVPTEEPRISSSAHVSTPDVSPVVPDTALPDTIRVPPNVCMAETDIGIAAFDLKTSTIHSLPGKASLIVKALQTHGAMTDAALALRSHYPSFDAATLSQDLTLITRSLLELGIIEAGAFEPFEIRPRQERTNDAAGEVAMIQGDIDKTGVRFRDYARMARAMLKAIKWAEHMNLYDVTEELNTRKRGLPVADRESIRRHMVAGHVLGRYSLFNRVVCADLTAATVLAESLQGRAAEYLIAFSPDPNYYHAAPGVNGKPVQTPQDRIMDENFTILGIF